MRMICPACGAILTADAAVNDEYARKCVDAISQLPPSVGRIAFAYIALFRPAGNRGLRWSTAARLASELCRMVKTGAVAKGRCAPRPATPEMWRTAIEQMVDNPPARLPLKNHNYLISIVYDAADAADRAAERRAEEERRMRTQARARKPVAEPERIGPEDWAALRMRLKYRKNREEQ